MPLKRCSRSQAAWTPESSTTGLFGETQSNGHLDTDLNTAWFAFQADYQKEPGSALDSARRLRSLLLDKFAPNQRLKFYRDSNTIVLDRQSHTGFAPEQFEILEYLWETGAGEVDARPGDDRKD